MSEFIPAMKVLIGHEVYAYGTPRQRSWSDIKGDRGGETNWGWSLLNIQRMGLQPADLGIKDFAPGCLKAMAESRAWELYRVHYWEPYRYKEIANQAVATKIFDFSVNSNPIAAGKMAQRALVAIGLMTDKDVDGKLGPMTVAALNKADASKLLSAMVRTQSAYYQALIDADATQQKFKNGWMDRAAWIG